MRINGSSGMGVPMVDLSVFTSGGDLEARQLAARDLAEKCRPFGAVGITGHGVSSDLLQEAFDTAKRLFDLPYEEKMKAPHPDGPTPHRGYSGTGRERVAAKTQSETKDEAQKDVYSKITDFKESYEIGSEENRVQYNIWLPEEVLPGFRAFTTQLFWQLKETADMILEALIMSLDLTEKEAENVRTLHTGHEDQLRLLHYPQIEETLLQDNESRLGAHTDWSLFTLLFQDTQGGLEFIDSHSGQSISATPQDGVVYMNIGDMLQRLSNGAYPSALHRVVSSLEETATMRVPERYSIPYFVAPMPDGIIVPQASRVKANGGKQLFDPVTFIEYSEAMVRAIQVPETEKSEYGSPGS